MTLNREIKQVKNKSFPELKWVFVRGIYVPDYKLLAQGNLAMISSDYTLRVFNGEKSIFPIVFVNVKFANSLSSPLYYHERTGIIAHELSHIILEGGSEKRADKESITRGYSFEIMKAAQLIERLGHSRKDAGSYSSSELAKMVG